MPERSDPSPDMQAAWDAAVAACLNGHENCSYGGMSPAGGYWLADPDCPRNHGDRCTWCGAEAVTGFAGRAGADVYGVPACQSHADAWAARHPEWARREEPVSGAEPSSGALMAAVQAERAQLLARMSPLERSACEAADLAVDNLLLWGNPDGPPPGARPEPRFDGFRSVLSAAAESGPPYTHTLTAARCELCAAAGDPECRDGLLYRDGGEELDYVDVYVGRCSHACHRVQPTLTIDGRGQR